MTYAAAACAALPGSGDFYRRRRELLALAAAGDGGAELIRSLGRRPLSAVRVKAGYEASLALSSDHETGSEP